jgi:hypothetical protein
MAALQSKTLQRPRTTLRAFKSGRPMISFFMLPPGEYPSPMDDEYPSTLKPIPGGLAIFCYAPLAPASRSTWTLGAHRKRQNDVSSEEQRRCRRLIEHKRKNPVPEVGRIRVLANRSHPPHHHPRRLVTWSSIAQASRKENPTKRPVNPNVCIRRSAYTSPKLPAAKITFPQTWPLSK